MSPVIGKSRLINFPGSHAQSNVMPVFVERRKRVDPILSDVFYFYFIFCIVFISIPRGLMARIPGFHPGGPGSIPGVGEKKFYFFEQNYFIHEQN